MTTPEERLSKVPRQLDVYFESFPAIDTAALARFINETDPGDVVCTVEPATDDQSGGAIRVEGYAAIAEPFMMGILIHGVPSPAAHIIDESRMPDKAKAALAKHQAFALLTVMGGDDVPKSEAMLFLYMVAIGLCCQGALGVGSPHTGHCFPADFLFGLLDAASNMSDEDEDEPMTLWNSIREYQEPRQLLADTVALEIGGQKWLVTRGHSQCGFPDLICPSETNDEARDVAEFFENAFSYMMENGPVIEAGHTMGGDAETLAFHFTEPPADLELPFPTFELLMATPGEPEQKPHKKRFGLF